MTNTLTQARADLAATLQDAGITTHDFLPERINPPVAFVTAGAPWVDSGPEFGTFNVGYTVTLVAPNATNDTATDELDSLVTATLVALFNAPDWGIGRVDEPHMLVVNGAQYLAARLAAVLTTAISTD